MTSDLPVHAGLWPAAEDTAYDLGARIAAVSALAARALDITLAALKRARNQGDMRSAAILQRILDDEIRHVAAGARHFTALCRSRSKHPEKHWKTLVKRHSKGVLKPLNNDSARLAAGLPREFYASIA